MFYLILRAVLGLIFFECISTKIIKFNTNLTWVKNLDEYELETRMRIGDVFTASLGGNPTYHLTFISQSGEHLLEIRPTSKGTTVIYNCEGVTNYKQFKLATSPNYTQQFTLTAQPSGAFISLDEEMVTLDIADCRLGWEEINKLEMGGSCRSNWGNWKSLRVIRNFTQEL